MGFELEDLPPSLAAKRVLRTKAAAAFLGIGDDEMKRRRLRGEMPPAVKLGKRSLGWTIESLVALIADLTEAPNPRSE